MRSFGEGVSADAGKGLRVRPSCIIGWALNPVTSVLTEKGEDWRWTERREKGRQCEDRGRGWRDAGGVQGHLEPPGAGRARSTALALATHQGGGRVPGGHREAHLCLPHQPPGSWALSWGTPTPRLLMSPLRGPVPWGWAAPGTPPRSSKEWVPGGLPLHQLTRPPDILLLERLYVCLCASLPLSPAAPLSPSFSPLTPHPPGFSRPDEASCPAVSWGEAHVARKRGDNSPGGAEHC